MKYKLTLALVAFMTSTAFAAFQAPLPEFKNEKQLAEWRAEKASESTSQGYAAEESAFYTGKPYLASSGSYAFRYRSYRPEVARWTSEDPSGFPDGANGNTYAPNPLSAVDYMGLNTVTVTGSVLGSLGTWAQDQIDQFINGKDFTVPVPSTAWDNPWTSSASASVTYSLSGTFKVNATIVGTGFEGSVSPTSSATYQVAVGKRISLEATWNIRKAPIGNSYLITHVAWTPKFTALPE
jgi:RHS repeat-associated protein